MTTSELTWRTAGPDDAVALRDLERAANLAALAHVFGDLPYPADDVLARWVLVLADPGVTVDVVDSGDGGLLACTAYDDRSLRHLAVYPDAWGRGLGRAGVERAVAHIRARGEVPHLWVLEANHRARALYDRLGWQLTGVSQECPWPPHPTELEMAHP
ncbi:hypothetical protein DDE18_10405 [Nocardioides gansuensis]|uniref:N-acetyltransferase domain-containing protein n=1 Tax=Nocardioides gansuensis TaxID=2138300 RepID=A0A2T8FAQ7_9ACTN|nr:GNAT family N-acetyltransferase [Nocardioides gansuensis]PVG82765.1 hypothetical protein DDE18_10405 [Nocardioides gansuensis]